ncbi:MAG: hypothetical protein JW714_02580, partial [Candidatus Omnitrophica bacterium]|nr:hypothetical protein [Candidatus Omnitrophota bacterium]
MQYLFCAWAKLEKKLKQAKYILLCLDFDGTLTPIKPKPALAKLGAERRLLLAGLVGSRDCLVAIISGRSLKDLKSKISLNGLVLAGNHGLEISYGKKKFIYPQAKRYVLEISR